MIEIMRIEDDFHTPKAYLGTQEVSGFREGNLLSFIHDSRRVERDGYCLPYEDEAYGEYADRVRAHPNFAIELLHIGHRPKMTTVMKL